MPQFSGWDFLDRYQELSSELEKDIKIHILTSSVRPIDKERSRQYSFIRSYINKPFDENVIREINLDA